MISNRVLICCTLLGIAPMSIGCSRSTPMVIEVHEQAKKAAPVVSTTPRATTPRPQTLNGEYNMDVACDTNSELHIRRVTVTDAATIVGMTFTSERNGSYEPTSQIQTGAPGQQSAFYIADPGSGKEYKLLNVEGIALQPSWKYLNQGDTVDFTLTFERIPDQLTKFHVIEGRVQTNDEFGRLLRSWTFMNVLLK